MTDQTPEHMTEAERRRVAFEQRGELLDEAAEVVTPRRMPQMISLRLDGEIVASLRDIANARGLSLSDVLREGADYVIGAWTGNSRLGHISYSSSVWPGRPPFTGSYDVLLQPASDLVLTGEIGRPAATQGSVTTT